METLEQTFLVTDANSRERFFETLYESTFPVFAGFVARRKGSFQDARDVFQDAMVVYYEKQEDPNFFLKETPEGYLLGIARHLWFRKFGRERRLVSLEKVEEELWLPADYFPEDKEVSLLNFLEKSGKKCLDLLHRFYFEKSSLKDIAAFLGYRTEHSAAVQKFKCIGKLRDAIKAKSIRYEDFN